MVMERMKSVKFLILVMLLISSGSLFAASFDCSKAKSFAEKTICSDPKLSKDDDDLKYLHFKAKSYVQDRKAFAEITKTLWNSRERCSDFACVNAWYDTAFAIYEAIANVGIPETNGVNDNIKNSAGYNENKKQSSDTTVKELPNKPTQHNPRDFALYDSKERAAPIEHNAALYKETPDALKFVDTLVGLVRQSSYKCDSVSAFGPLLLSNGFSLACNKFRYKYEIKDNGGHIAVTVDN